MGWHFRLPWTSDDPISFNLQDPADTRDLLDENDPRWGGSGEDNRTLAVGGTPQNRADVIASRLSVVWRGVAVLSNTLAILPAMVKQRTEQGVKPLPMHPISRVLINPNRHQTGFDFRQTLMRHLVLRGNAYADIASSARRGWAHSLSIIHPDRIWPYEQMPDGRITYWHFPADFRHRSRKRMPRIKVGGEDLLHLRGLSDDGFVGLSVLGAMRRQVESSTQMEEFGRRFFRQAPTQRGVIEPTVGIRPEQAEQFAKQIKASQAGPKNWMGTLVLRPGMKWVNVGLNNEDAQWLESRQFSIEDFARFLGVPMVLLMHSDRSSLYANAQKFFESFAKFDLAPWIASFEQTLTKVLLLEAEQDQGLFVDIDADGLMRGSPTERAAFYKTTVGRPFITPNEAREREGMNRMDGQEFDKPGAPAQTGGMPKPSQAPPRPGKPPAEDEE